MKEQFMQLAIEEAKRAFHMGEVPVGAVLVSENRVIATSHNLVETSCDASAHAELLCLKKAAGILNNWRLTECTLYCTLEPCIMCAGAMHLFRIKNLVYGARDLRHGALGSHINLRETKHPIHDFEVEGGVLEEACSDLMRRFFQLRRGQKCEK